MDYSVRSHKLRRGIRYTFTHINGRTFRADFDKYIPQHGIPREAIVLKNVEGLQGALHMPLDFVSNVKIYALSQAVKQFPYLIPQVSMSINNYV